ncbi:hypothetical protein KM043_017174 [Ampulex compressa]|nr:hypothetical protein KM043_017174 [Ampulex compressa]
MKELSARSHDKVKVLGLHWEEEVLAARRTIKQAARRKKGGGTKGRATADRFKCCSILNLLPGDNLGSFDYTSLPGRARRCRVGFGIYHLEHGSEPNLRPRSRYVAETRSRFHALTGNRDYRNRPKAVVGLYRNKGIVRKKNEANDEGRRQSDAVLQTG